MNKYKIAVCQTDTQDNIEENLNFSGSMIDKATDEGASLIAFPETMNYIGKDFAGHAEPIPGRTSDFLCQKARERHIWIMGGSITEQTKNGKPRNTLLLIDPEGEIRCTYSKLHMFDVQLTDGTSCLESSYSTAGNEIVLADAEPGRFGFSICYDLRFPELFRIMALDGAQVIFLPANFTYNTGKNHWEALLRARAIENGVYLVAPDQCGKKPSFTAYGNSMVVDPWGNVIARAGNEPGCIYADINLGEIENARRQIPSLKNRRTDVYELQKNPHLLAPDSHIL